MEPNEHDNLLFDDGAFSRSRRYFWAIDCLSEVGPLRANIFFSEPLRTFKICRGSSLLQY